MNHSLHTLFSRKTLRRNLPRFIGAGLFVTSVLLLVATITDRVTDGAVRAMLIDDAVFSNSSSLINEKKLPIYCVKTDKKQIALTFDGAWGDGGYGTDIENEPLPLTGQRLVNAKIVTCLKQPTVVKFFRNPIQFNYIPPSEYSKTFSSFFNTPAFDLTTYCISSSLHQ